MTSTSSKQDTCHTAYNGWTNHETWSLDLVLNNDRWLQELTTERVADALESYEPDDPYDLSPDSPGYGRANVAGEAVKELWEELIDPSGELMDAVGIVTLLGEVGSWWRVNWHEIGQSWVDSAREQQES